MRIRLLGLVLAVVAVTVSGCASGPIRGFFRGGACNACAPARPGWFQWRGNSATMCESPGCQGHGQVIESGVSGDYSGGTSGGYGIDPFGSSAPVYGPISPPNSGRLPGPTGSN